MLTIENRAGIDVLVMNKGAQPATEGEVALFTEVVRLRAEVEALRADAERYRWLRAQHWFDSNICVVVNPKTQLLLGTHCPFEEKLDAAIDAARAAQGGEHG